MKLSDPWFAGSYLAIKQEPIFASTVKHSSGLLWNHFSSCPEVKVDVNEKRRASLAMTMKTLKTRWNISGSVKKWMLLSVSSVFLGFNAEGEEWERQRKVVSQALNLNYLKNFFPTLVAITKRLLNWYMQFH